jgi:hypothetical protein
MSGDGHPPALTLAISPEALEALVAEVVDGVVAKMRDQLGAASAEGWLDTKRAAEYAGCSVNALQKAMAASEVRFTQDGRGRKAWFKREWIDAWRGG